MHPALRHYYYYSSSSEALPSIIAYEHSISNKFVDVYFDGGVYSANDGTGALTTNDLSLSFTAGGASAMSIASIKKPDHHTSASASNLAGGESVIRVFLTITGTVDGTESYEISAVANSVFDADGEVASADSGTGDITLNVNPFALWDAEEPTTITTTGAGISAMSDVMGNVNLTQTTDADRPLYYLQSSIQFDRTNGEQLNGGNNANFAKQQNNNFAVVIKDFKPNMGASVGWAIGYFNASTTNGWFVRSNAGTLQIGMFDPVTNNIASFPNFEDQEASFIFQNEGGVLSIYDENNNLVGTQGSTSISPITYTGVNLVLGNRDGSITTHFNGEYSKIGFYNQALSSSQRAALFSNIRKQDHLNPTGVVTKYLFPVLNGSTNSSAGDTMQCFLGAVISRNGTQHLFYTGNNAVDDDKIFKATRTDDDSNTPFVKVMDGGLPKVIVAPSGVNGTWNENEVFVRDVVIDEDGDEALMYYTGNQIGASPSYTAGLATSPLSDLETFTDQGQIYTDGTKGIITFAVCKRGAGDWVAIVTTSAAGGDTNNFSYDYLSSADGVTWTKEFNVNSLFSGIILLSQLIRIDSKLYVIASANNRDSELSTASEIVVYEVADDFLSSTYLGVLVSKLEPTERGVALPYLIAHDSYIEIFYTYYKNQNKTSANGGEAYTSIRRATLNKSTFQSVSVTNQYPSWIKKYWPLNPESATGNAFREMIDGDTASFSAPRWSLDGLNFMDFVGTGITFTNNGTVTGRTTDFALKMRVEIVTTGTIDLFEIGTDIVVQLVSGNLRVALNNGTKDYITNADIAKPADITDPGTHVYVGFIWQGGVLKLCVGNTIDIASTKTVDNAMTDILDGGGDVKICEGATIEARSFVVMSGQTDQQWIDTDL